MSLEQLHQGSISELAHWELAQPLLEAVLQLLHGACTARADVKEGRLSQSKVRVEQLETSALQLQHAC